MCGGRVFCEGGSMGGCERRVFCEGGFTCMYGCLKVVEGVCECVKGGVEGETECEEVLCD